MKFYFMVAAALIVPLLGGCDDKYTAARAFPAKNPSYDEQKVAIRTYDSRQKWYIFAYGNARGTVSLELASVIAEDGKPVIDAMEEDLRDGNPDLNYYSAASLLSRIQDNRTYDVCADAPLYARFKGYAADIDTPEIKSTYLLQLTEMCAPVAKPVG